jgi:serine/threonine protein kinase
MPPLTPNTLVADRYTVTELVPDRGLGETWRARDLRREGATVQLKFLRAVDGDDVPPDALKVLRAVRALRHPVIPSVVNQGVHAGRPFIASDDILGDSIGARLDQSRARGELLDLALIRQLFDGVAAALTAAHTAPLPVLHGALTPGSVVVLARPVRGATCALLDLGLAPWLDPPTDLVARSARALITPAPELARGAPPTVATDVFSLAALLTELLATPTSPGETMMAVSVARRRNDVPPGVWGVLEQAMALRPDERFQSVDALANALTRSWSEAPPAKRPTALESLASRAPTGPSSLLETCFPESAPRVSAPLPGVMPDVAAQAPAAPLLGAMPALGPPPEPARPPGWENPWSTMLIQGKSPPPRASEPDDMGATLMEPMRSRPPREDKLGATVARRDVHRGPPAALGALARWDAHRVAATLIATSGRARADVATAAGRDGDDGTRGTRGTRGTTGTTGSDGQGDAHRAGRDRARGAVHGGRDGGVPGGALTGAAGRWRS